jgi:selenide,water dikinase
MGGEPEVALSYAGLPEALGLDVLEAVLQGMNETCRAAGCAIVGGHTLRDAEPKCGLAVIGSVEPGAAWSHLLGRAGQALVLTKALGTGVLAQALRAGQVDEAALARAVRQMETLNASACRAGRKHGVRAATDVTGFGLLGHLQQLATASGVGARVDTAAVPLLDGAFAAAQAGHVPGGSRRNARYVEQNLSGHELIDPVLLTLLSDAQTSGGLLLVVDEQATDALLGEIGAPAARIGELVPTRAGSIELV